MHRDFLKRPTLPKAFRDEAGVEVATELSDQGTEPCLLDERDARAWRVRERDLATWNAAVDIDGVRHAELGRYGDVEADLRLGVRHRRAVAEIQRRHRRE